MGPRGPGQQDEVAPPVQRVLIGAHDDMVAAISDGAPLGPPDCQIRLIAHRTHMHYLIVDLRGARTVRSDVAQPPVTANQTPTPAGPVTKMIGAMQGWGRLTLASILEFPAASALKLSVLMLVIAAAPSAPML